MNGLMKFFDGFDRVFTSVFNMFFGALWLAAAIAGGVLSWLILGMLEYSVVVQVLGTVAGGLLSGLAAWIVYQFMKAGAGW
ncbi:MAG: hypothetical protein AAF296_08380 [Pseudomonadota bacterium]